MHAIANKGRSATLGVHPVSELLECPPETSLLLTGAAQCVHFDAGDPVFHQNDGCLGLYLVISGEFLRRSDRFSTRITLGTARVGELVELAAALGERRHTYTLSALTPGVLLLLPIDALERAFASHPPLRMHLLEELAREVSRAYRTSCSSRTSPARRRPNGAVCC
ncbi:MAG: Crp/Fnr family transcriptional regulator [Acidobacteriota bacterium]